MNTNNTHAFVYVFHSRSLIRHRMQVAPLMDKRVVICGTSRADMNGMSGVATDFHPMGGPKGDRTTWRYTVKLDSGEEYKLRPEKLRAEEKGGGAGGGARSKEKGGKKGGKKNRGRS